MAVLAAAPRYSQPGDIREGFVTAYQGLSEVNMETVIFLRFLWLVNLQTIVWLIARLIAWLSGRSILWSFDELIDWLVDWVFDRSVDWLIDWLKRTVFSVWLICVWSLIYFRDFRTPCERLSTRWVKSGSRRAWRVRLVEPYGKFPPSSWSPSSWPVKPRRMCWVDWSINCSRSTVRMSWKSGGPRMTSVAMSTLTGSGFLLRNFASFFYSTSIHLQVTSAIQCTNVFNGES